MAAWLVLDWDQDQFHIVAVQSARRGVHVVKAATWAHPEPFTPSTAERVGKALRDFLAEGDFPTAPVIVGLGRDRIFLKELRFPPLPAHEEAALVRFQTGKELTESIDSFAVDYVHLNEGSGERQIMTAAVRREVVAMVQALCTAAALKLQAITPRLFGAGLAVERALRPEPSPLAPKTLNVVLSLGSRWGELCFYSGTRLLQAQALANGPLLAAEVRRNLAVFRAQHAVSLDLAGPECLYVFAEDKSSVKGLENGTSNLPIRLLDPLQPEPAVSDSVKQPSAFAGAAGLAELWAHAVQKPVNLAEPKKPKPPTSITRQRAMFYGATVGLFALLAISAMWYVLSQKKAEIARLQSEKEGYEQMLQANAQERADLEAYKDWQQTTVPWLDEIYDLTARFPFEQGFRINQLSGQSVAIKKAGKDAKDKDKDVYIGVMNFTMFTPADQGKLATLDLPKSMQTDSHLRVTVGHLRILPGNNAPHEYKGKIDIAKQEADKYVTRLIVPQRPFLEPPMLMGDPLEDDDNQ